MSAQYVAGRADDRPTPEAAGFDLILRALSQAHDDETILTITAPIFDAVHDYIHRNILTRKIIL